MSKQSVVDCPICGKSFQYLPKAKYDCPKCGITFSTEVKEDNSGVENVDYLFQFLSACFFLGPFSKAIGVIHKIIFTPIKLGATFFNGAKYFSRGFCGFLLFIVIGPVFWLGLCSISNDKYLVGFLICLLLISILLGKGILYLDNTIYKTRLKKFKKD